MSPPNHSHEICEERHRTLQAEIAGELRQIKETLGRVEAQTTETNGRVRALERAKLIIATAVIVLAAMYGVPEAIGKVTTYMVTHGAVALSP